MQDNVFIQIPNFIFLKNTHSVFLNCNNNFAIAAGLEGPQQIRGKTDFDLPWADSHAELYQDGDREVLDGIAKHHHIETQLRSNGEIVSILINKVPLLNNKGDTVGVIGSYMEMMQHEYRGQYDSEKINIAITKEEGDILYYFAKGLSPQQIASMMELPLTIFNTRLDVLKYKLKVDRNSTLIKKALSLDFTKRRLLNKSDKLDSPFTVREVDILNHLILGKTAKGIAAELNLSFRTVENHLVRIKEKAGVKTKAELIAKIFKQELINL